MSCRTTRTRSAKIALGEAVEQPKITDAFKVIRGRGRPQKKLLDGVKEDVAVTKLHQQTRSFQQLTTVGECSSVDIGSVCSPPKRAKKGAEHQFSRSAKKALFRLSDDEAIVVKQEIVDKHQSNEAGKVTKAPAKLKVELSSTQNLMAKPENSTEAIPADDTQPSVYGDPLISRTDSMQKKLLEAATQRKTRARIRNVAELQALLAEKGAAKKIHEQTQHNRSKQVEELAKEIKSPEKTVPIGKARAKVSSKLKIEKNDKHERTSSAPAVPDYILPVQKTPAKHPLDEYELENNRHVLEYGRASRLVEEVKRNSTLPLPLSYARLHDTFQSCDRVISIYISQGRRCVVNEIQKNVEKNTQIKFTRKHLAQIVNVYPTCYEIRLEKCWNPFGGGCDSRGKMELTISANLVDDLKDYMLSDTPLKSYVQPLPPVTPSKLISPRKKAASALPREPLLDAKPRLEGWRLVCRSYVFRHKLVEVVKKFHQKFLERLGLKIKESELARLRRFHPKFDLDKDCEDIEQAKLPEEDHNAEERHLEMRDYFAAVDTSVALPKAVKAAIEDLKSPLKRFISTSLGVPLSPRQFAEKQASKPKGAMSLLERIREKEAQRKAAERLRDPVVEKRIDALERILHGLLRCITT